MDSGQRGIDQKIRPLESCQQFNVLLPISLVYREHAQLLDHAQRQELFIPTLYDRRKR
jgi:hypothetical protein